MGLARWSVLPIGWRIVLGVLVSIEVGQLFHLGFQVQWVGLVSTSLATWLALEGWWRWQDRTPELFSLAIVVPVSAILLVLLDFGGNAWEWYAALWWFDVLLHMIGGAAGTLYSYAWLRIGAERYQWTSSMVFIGIFAVLLASFGGVLFEAFEWSVDAVLGTRFWLGDARDTVGDLLCNVLGGAVAMGLYFTEQRFRQPRKAA